MELKVVWTKRASRNYLQILDYIVGRFGNGAGLSYQKKVEHLVGILSQFPELGTSQTPDGKLRAMVLYRRTIIFYKYSKQKITVVNLVDSRWSR